MANVCTVTGTLRWSSGALAKSVAVHVVQPGIRRAWDGAALPIVATATSDAVTGAVTFDLIPGFYQLVWQDDLGAVQAGMRVPDEAAADLQDIVQAQTAVIAPAPGDTGYPYDNDTCRIVGTLFLTSGAPAANETIRIVQDAIRPAWDGAALPVVQAITADGNGEVDFDLIPGHYRMVWQDGTAQAQRRLYVPDAPFVWLRNLFRNP